MVKCVLPIKDCILLLILKANKISYKYFEYIPQQSPLLVNVTLDTRYICSRSTAQVGFDSRFVCVHDFLE